MDDMDDIDDIDDDGLMYNRLNNIYYLLFLTWVKIIHLALATCPTHLLVCPLSTTTTTTTTTTDYYSTFSMSTLLVAVQPLSPPPSQPSQPPQPSHSQPFLAPAAPARATQSVPQKHSTSSAISQSQSQPPTQAAEPLSSAAIAPSTVAPAALAAAAAGARRSGVRLLLRSPLRTPQRTSAKQRDMSLRVPVQGQSAAQGVSNIFLTLKVAISSRYLSFSCESFSRQPAS